MNTTPKAPTQRDELDSVELLFLAELLAKQPDATDYAELGEKLRRLSERYITDGK